MLLLWLLWEWSAAKDVPEEALGASRSSGPLLLLLWWHLVLWRQEPIVHVCLLGWHICSWQVPAWRSIMWTAATHGSYA